MTYKNIKNHELRVGSRHPFERRSKKEKRRIVHEVNQGIIGIQAAVANTDQPKYLAKLAGCIFFASEGLSHYFCR